MMQTNAPKSKTPEIERTEEKEKLENGKISLLSDRRDREES